MPISTIGPRGVLGKVACTGVALLRSVQPMTGHGQHVLSSLRTGERPMSENTIDAALRGLGYGKKVQSAHGFRRWPAPPWVNS